jgi:outer membrane translocation and assembly module TamA
VNGSWHYSSRNSLKYPTKGIDIETGYSYLNNLKQSSRNLLKLSAAVSLYYTFFNRLTVAHRSGAATNLGDYEFYQANTLGNAENLRGYWRSRFAGRSSVYQNTELRYQLANLRGYVFRGHIGLIGFFDDGRVWIKDESSDKIHTGYGGGVYYLPYNMMAFTAYVATSPEVTFVTLRAGFFF